MESKYQAFTLSNGLHVLLKEIHTAPIVSSWIWYAIGSRNELPGKTGLSHWVEHMQFKGTRNYTAEEMDESIARIGGSWNAFTSADWTTYFETLPSNHINLALDIEADRMKNSLFDPEEVETERTVIISEREGSENDPQFLLAEKVQLEAFENHPYRNEVIGSKEDLMAETRADLFRHYQSFYQPANATLSIAGDFDTHQLIDLLNQKFASIPSLPFSRFDPEPEPELNFAKKVDIEGPGEVTFMQIAYRTPSASSPDFFAYTILDSLLTGPSSLNMFGSGGISNRTSRLYQALVEKQIASSVYGNLNATIDPGTYTIYLTSQADHPVEEALKHLDEVMDDLLNQLIKPDEIEKAVKQARALFAYGSDNITNQAFWLGYASSFATYEWFNSYVAGLQSVTPEMLLDTARRYLQPEHRVIGIYRPNGAGGIHD